MPMQTITIQSDKANLAQVETLLSRFCDENNIGNYFATISVAVLQAAENAIVHGNHSDPAKNVSVSYGYCNGGVFFEVSDEGEGFDADRYVDLPDTGTVGTGIFIIRSLADHVEFSRGGRSVRMEFFIRGIESSVASARAATLQKFYMPKEVQA